MNVEFVQRGDQDAGRADLSCMPELGVSKDGLGKDATLPSIPGSEVFLCSAASVDRGQN